MTETDKDPSSAHLPPRFELEQIDEYSQYVLHSATEIVAVLRSVLQKEALITVHFDQGASFFLTSMLSLSPESGQFVIDVGSNAEMNRRALLASRLIFTTLIDKVKVQFSVDRLQSTESQGRPAFFGKIPERLLRLQRREFFRLAMPIANPVKLCATVKDAAHGVRTLDAPLLDISGGGLGLMVTPDQAACLDQGLMLENCKIMLPGEGLLVATLCVRNQFDVTARNGAHFRRIGCEYIALPPARLTAIQRYITRIERERKARFNGLA